jgi:hypothetical protein
MKTVLALALLLLGSIAFLSPAQAEPNRPYICHAEGMDNKDTWNKAFPVNEGQMFGHIGHQNGEDIIPPFEYEGNTYSQNWFEPFISIYLNDCAAVVDPTSTATETPTNTPTDTPTNTPTNTATATATETASATSTATETSETPTEVSTPTNTPNASPSASATPTEPIVVKTPITVTTMPDTGSGSSSGHRSPLYLILSAIPLAVIGSKKLIALI